MDTRTKSHAGHTSNNFLVYLELILTVTSIQSTGKILLQSMLFKVLKNPSAGFLEIYLYQMTLGCKIMDVFIHQLKNSPQHVKH